VLADNLAVTAVLGDGFNHRHQALMRSKWNYVMPGLPQRFR
jgi:hypothetical protein